MSAYKSDISSKKLNILTLFLFLGTAVLFGLGLDQVGLFDVDEAIFAQASKEMVQSGDYIVPTYNAEPRYHKPPLIYWLQSLSMSQLGVNELAARLPSAVAGFLMVLAFYLFVEFAGGRSKQARKYALTATAVLAFNISFLMLARASIADMVMNFFIFTATMALVLNMFIPQRQFMPLFVAGILLALGLMTKGPVVLLVPGVVIGTLWLVRGQKKYHFKAVNPFIVLVFMALGLFPWIQHIISERGVSFLTEFWWVHNVERFFNGFGNSQSSSPFYYLIVLLIGFFPWVLFLPSSIWCVATDFFKRLRSQDLMEALPAIGLIWMLAVVVFFSFSATKLPHYIVPALPGAALLVGWRLTELPNRDFYKINLIWMLPFVLLFGVFFMALKFVIQALRGEGGPVSSLLEKIVTQTGGSWPIEDAQLHAILAQDVVISIVPFMLGAIVIIGIGSGMIIAASRYRQGVVMVAASQAMALILMVTGVVPVVYQFMQKPLQRIAVQIEEDYQPGMGVYHVAMHHPSVLFYSNMSFIPLNSPQEAGYKLKHEEALLVVEQDKVETLQNALTPTFKTTANCDGGYCLVKAVKQTREQRWQEQQRLYRSRY